jgi:hypothetical protein
MQYFILSFEIPKITNHGKQRQFCIVLVLLCSPLNLFRHFATTTTKVIINNVLHTVIDYQMTHLFICQ